jgi:hypothetical protein
MTTTNKREARPLSPMEWLQKPGVNLIQVECEIFNQHVNNAMMGGAKFSIWNLFSDFRKAYNAHYFAYLKNERGNQPGGHASLKTAYATGPEVATGPGANRPSTPATKPSFARSSLG